MKNILKKIMNFLKNTGEKIQDTHPAIQIIAFSVLAGIFFLVFVSLLFHPYTNRSIFFFPDTRTGAPRAEIRYLPKVHGTDSRLNLYVSELLLGPIGPTYKPLYPKNVRILRCFTKKNTAYIDLSAAALELDGGTTSYIEAFAFFKKNVFTNFRNVDKIYLYIDGVEIYSGDPNADAEQKIKKR